MKKQIVIEVDEELHRDFKTACSWLNKTMKDVLISHITDFCEKSGISRGIYEKNKVPKVPEYKVSIDRKRGNK